jgi:hypothetical protein
VRGDYDLPSEPEPVIPGPSPRAWGLRGRGGLRAEALRAIPTCVGTTDSQVAGEPTISGHPHVRGDYQGPGSGEGLPPGPSPRAWGLLAPSRALPGGGRAIPTCVGTTSPLATPSTTWPGHPHVRGDYDHLIWHRDTGPGPSPRAWGLRWPAASPSSTPPGHPHVRGDYARLVDTDKGQVRAIPTCVGTTVPGPLTGRGSGHPHVRGDYESPVREPFHPGVGPSPRAWGPRAPPGCQAIPTCVGTTLAGRFAKLGPRAKPGHPHVRGDYGLATPGVGLLLQRRTGRAIPTCVGTTPVDPPPPRPPRAWGLRPHGRGERAIPTCATVALSRGHRAIPTCVGTTPFRSGTSPLRAIPTCVGTTGLLRSRRGAGHPHVRGDYT